MNRFLLLLLFFILAIFSTPCFIKTSQQASTLPEQEQMPHDCYWYGGLEAIHPATDRGGDSGWLLVTRCKPDDMIKWLSDSIGKADFSGEGLAEPYYGTYTWPGLRLRLDTYQKGISAYELTWTRIGSTPFNNDSVLLHWLTDFQERFLLKQPPDPPARHSREEFELAEFMHWNMDSLSLVFRSFVTKPEIRISIETEIDTSGKISDIRISPSSNLLEMAVRCSLEKRLPVLREKSSGLATRYSLEWEIYMPRNEQLAFFKKQLAEKCTLCRELEVHQNEDSLYYETTILQGHLFSKTSEHALFQLYGYPEVYLYEKVKKRWVYRDSMLSEYTGDNYFWWIEELDGKPLQEIALRSGYNSNGNCWMELIRYDTLKQRLYCGGHFNTNYKPDFARQELLTEYGGSWYMPIYHEIQKWINGKLVGYKKVEIALKETTMESDERIMTEYENPWWKSGKDTLIPVRHYQYTGTPAQEKIYELFGGRKIYD